MLSMRWLCFCVIVSVCYGQQKFVVPEVFLQAFSPAGFRAFIKAEPGIELFAFHAKINEPIYPNELGDLYEDIKVDKDGYFMYNNPTLRLQEGDVVHYWVFVQKDQLGYRKDGQKWQVTDLKSPLDEKCVKSVTQVKDEEQFCTNSSIFIDDFSTFDQRKWTWEQYIPEGPDYEFVIYKKDPTVTFIDAGTLKIRPKMLSDEEIAQDEVDIRDGCTRNKPTLCRFKKFLINNPIVSGRLVTKKSFSYAEVEVSARLPSGDWIYPEIYLEEDTDTPELRKKIFLAYARGNKVLVGNDNIDIGGSLLFGGPVMGPTEPARSAKLSSFRIQSGALSNDFHRYKIRWTPEKMELSIDGSVYGTISSNSIASSGFTGLQPTKVRLVIGVGVGGISDFPDDYRSGVHKKPWKNRNREQVKLFYSKKDDWYPTWTDNGQMIVEYVKITSI